MIQCLEIHQEYEADFGDEIIPKIDSLQIVQVPKPFGLCARQSVVVQINFHQIRSGADVSRPHIERILVNERDPVER